MYEKPMILASDDLAEGIYLASGDGCSCWKVTVKESHQEPVNSRKSTKFQIEMHHIITDQSHWRNDYEQSTKSRPQRLYIVFDRCVDVVECNEATLVGCSCNVKQIQVDFYSADNGNETIGWGGLAVAAKHNCDCKVSICRAWMTDL